MNSVLSYICENDGNSCFISPYKETHGIKEILILSYLEAHISPPFRFYGEPPVVLSDMIQIIKRTVSSMDSKVVTYKDICKAVSSMEEAEVNVGEEDALAKLKQLFGVLLSNNQ